MKKRWIALLCAAALLCSLCTPASAVTIIFTALNDTLLPLTDSTMPIYYKGTIYMPTSSLDSNVVSVDMGVTVSTSTADMKVTITGQDRTLVFEVNKALCLDKDGSRQDIDCVYRGGVFYVEAYVVCSYFGLRGVLLASDYGPVLRVTTGEQVLDNAEFLDAAGQVLQSRLNRYYASTQPGTGESTSQPSGSGSGTENSGSSGTGSGGTGTSVTPPATTSPTTPSGTGGTTTTTPSGSTISGSGQNTTSPTPADKTPEPEVNAYTIYVAFRCTGEELSGLLDRLETVGLSALLLIDPSELTMCADQLRRALAQGHSIGLIVDSGLDFQGQLQTVTYANELLRQLVCARTPIIAGGSQTQWKEVGYVCWRANYVSSALSASTLVRGMEGRSGSVIRAELNPELSVSALTALIRQMEEDGSVFLAPTGSRL